MTKKWTHTAAFESFGVKPRNVQWSWSARNEDTKIVVVTFWQDEFVKCDGKLIYTRPARSPDNLDARPGMKELLDNLAWAHDHNGGRLHVISAIAKDKTAHPRSILECFPTRMVMRLTHLDIKAQSFVAEWDAP